MDRWASEVTNQKWTARKVHLVGLYVTLHPAFCLTVKNIEVALCGIRKREKRCCYVKFRN